MTKQTKQRTNKAKEIYISLNLEEFAKLEKLSFRERWAYLALKRIANFKTGTVGQFGKQKLSYTEIATLIKPPAGVQGRGEGKIDDTQARDFILRMESEGLVSGIGRRPNGGLCFTLPLSPIDRTKVGKKPIISPEKAWSKIDEFIIAAAVAEVDPSPLSVMTSQENNINTEEAAIPSCDGAASCRAEGAAALRENPPVVAAGAAPLSAQQIHDALAGGWQITGIDTDEAWRLYESWAGSITLDELHAAMNGVEETEECPDPTPAALSSRLWPSLVDKGLGQLSV